MLWHSSHVFVWLTTQKLKRVKRIIWSKTIILGLIYILELAASWNFRKIAHWVGYASYNFLLKAYIHRKWRPIELILIYKSEGSLKFELILKGQESPIPEAVTCGKPVLYHIPAYQQVFRCPVRKPNQYVPRRWFVCFSNTNLYVIAYYRFQTPIIFNTVSNYISVMRLVARFEVLIG